MTRPDGRRSSDSSISLPRIPHVGRGAELALLCDWLADVAKGGGGVQFLAGEPGAGKTRLAATVAQRAERDGWRAATGTVYAVERGVPYALWADVLAALLRDMDPGARQVLTRGGSWLGMICPPLADGHAATNADIQGDAKARLMWNCADMLVRISQKQPLLLVLDNLHMADSASLELLHFVARQASRARIGVVGTYVDAERDLTAGLRAMEQSLLTQGIARLMRVNPLTSADVEQILGEMFSVGQSAVQGIAGRLHERTGGNPFFVLEILKALVESGQLHRRDDQWVGWEATELELPRSVRVAVLERLERLAPGAQRVAVVAAVIGARVGFDTLREVSELRLDELLSGVDDLVRSGILVESAQPRNRHDGGGAYEFAHPILREVIYESAGIGRTQVLHAAIADALEARFREHAVTQADVLAFHFARAGPTAGRDKAATYLAAAGRDALSRNADRAAADYLGAALELGAGAGIAIIEDLARARQRLGEYDEAIALWQRAYAAAAAAGETARCARIERRVGLAYYWSGRLEDSLAHHAKALQLAADAGDAFVEARARIARGACLQSLGRPSDAAADLNAALKTAERLGDATLQARAHRALLFLHVFAGPPDAARSHGERAVALAEASGERRIEWSAHYGLATLAGLTGDGPGMLQRVKLCERLADELQSPVLRVHTGEMAMQYAFGSGDWTAGLAAAEENIALARALRQGALLPRLLTWVTRFYTARGEAELARRYLDEAWELAVACADRGRPVEVHTQIVVIAGMGVYHLLMEEHERALELAVLGLEVADRAGYSVWAVYPLLPLAAEASFYLHDVPRAEQFLERARRESARLGHTLGAIWVQTAEGIIARVRGEWPRAAELLRASIAGLEAVPWVYDAARLRRWLADVLIRMGETDAGMRELRTSHEMCASLGTQLELGRAREMMKLMGLRPPPRGNSGGRVAQLTERETEIVRLVVARKSNKEIAAALGIATRTVTTHVANIFAKIGVSSRGELADRMRNAVERHTAPD